MNQQTKSTVTDETSEQMVVMELANESYGVDIDAVNTIIRMQEVTKIPRSEDFVDGVINLRGSIVPVIDLRKKFRLDATEITKASRIVVVEAAGQVIGMIVDSVVETLRLPKDAIEPPSPVVVSVDSQYVRGVGKQDDRLVILLDIDKIMTAGEMESLADVQRQVLDEQQEVPEAQEAEEAALAEAAQAAEEEQAAVAA